MKDSISNSEKSNSTENNEKNAETIEKTDPNIPKDFSPVNYLDPSTESSIVTLYKSKEWDTIIPTILDAIEHCKDETGYGDYPYFRIQNTINFLPKLNVESEILNEQLLKELHCRLPYYHQFSNWKRLYSLSKDGCALKTLINKTQENQNTILIVKDDENNIFGAYASEAFELSGNFYGTGETFLFSFFKDNRIHVYNSTGINENYIYGDEKQIAFGCSDDYFSLTLENDLYDGYSRMTQTYKNQRLNGNKDKFIIIKLEVWTFQNN